MKPNEFLEEVTKVFPEGKLELEKAKDFLPMINSVNVILRQGADQFSDRNFLLYEDGSIAHVSLLDKGTVIDKKHLAASLDDLQFKKGYHLEKIQLSMDLEVKK